MKKLFGFFAGLFVLINSLSGLSFDYIQPGSYVYYIDLRNEVPYARGYLFCPMNENETLVISNVINLETNASYRSMIVFGEDEDKNLEMGNAKIPEIPEEEKNLVMQFIPDLMNFDAMYRNNEEKIGFETVLEDPWDNFSLYYKFSNCIPMFKFTAISFGDESMNNVKYYAFKFGQLTSLNDEVLKQFFDCPVKVFKETKRDVLAIVPKKPAKGVNISGLDFQLDENWEKSEFEGNDSWWLKVTSIRDAQIMVENIPPQIDTSTIEKKLDFVKLIIPVLQNLMPETVKIWPVDNDLFLTYYSYDENNFMTFTRIQITDTKIINFSAFKDIYEFNEAYFNRILDLESNKYEVHIF